MLLKLHFWCEGTSSERLRSLLYIKDIRSRPRSR